jgi:hypothetical protein
MTKYRATIHQHIIMDVWVEAPDRESAWQLANDQVNDREEKGDWIEDVMAGWTEVGSIYDEEGDEVE